MAEGEIDNITMEQYLALTRGNQAPGMVKPEIIGNVNFKIKSQFMYCPPLRTAKQLEEIRNFKQEGDETLYQAWERYNELLYKCPTHDINNHQNVNIFYNGLGAMNCQLLDSQGPIPSMPPVQALTAIQTMTDHSQK
ncbi:alpha/beta hydrolases superfamily protein [Tanacetum coccineum]